MHYAFPLCRPTSDLFAVTISLLRTSNIMMVCGLLSAMSINGAFHYLPARTITYSQTYHYNIMESLLYSEPSIKIMATFRILWAGQWVIDFMFSQLMKFQLQTASDR